MCSSISSSLSCFSTAKFGPFLPDNPTPLLFIAATVSTAARTHSLLPANRTMVHRETAHVTLLSDLLFK